MPSISDQHGRAVPVRWSAGNPPVLYFERWQDNVLAPPTGQEWPPSLLRQVRQYTARRSWFSQDDADALAKQLGRISKFQSINSEDALTWSWFGTLSCERPDHRRRALTWLYDRLGLDLTASNDAVIDQWERVIHPNSRQSSNGPELDARIDDPGAALVYVEAKWNAGLGMGKGAVEGESDDQIILRRDSLRVDLALADDDREFVVLGVSDEIPDLGVYDEGPSNASRRTVKIGWLTWAELADCAEHPRSSEFVRYLGWKRALSQAEAGQTGK